MQEAPTTPPAVIDAIGISKLASRLNRPVTTVASWKARNSIPVEVWPDLIAYAPECGVSGVTYESMTLMHALKPEPAQ